MTVDTASSSASRVRIAVLDDNHLTRLLVRRLLEVNMECEVRLHATPAELFAEAEPPDLYLLDIVLGDECGLEVGRRIAAGAQTQAVPVVYFSEHAQPQTRLDALRCGGVDYIDKPFFPSEFVQRVRGVLERGRRRRQLEAQTAEQHALLRVLCHDLRNSVGSAHALLSHFGPEQVGAAEYPHYHQLALQASQSALDLIAHVAEYRSLLDAERPFKLEAVAVAEAARESARLLEPAARQKGIVLKVDVAATFAIKVNRVVLVHNILNNLLSNAIKFSHPGSTVWLEAEPAESKEGGEAGGELRVRDEGIGMSHELLESLHQPGPVTSRPGTASEPGTGLGLQLVRLYVARCGGRMTVESLTAETAGPAAATGTTVRLAFPLAVPV